MEGHDPEIRDSLDPKGDRNFNMPVRVVFILVLAMAVALPSFGVEIIHVPSDVTTLESAIGQIGDGGIIEMVAGTYTSPGGGWFFGNLQKSFTIRADKQAMVTLTGAGSKPVLRIQNTSPSLGGQINFEGLTFTNGRSTENGVGGGVTLEANDAVFTDCVFDSNESHVHAVLCRFGGFRRPGDSPRRSHGSASAAVDRSALASILDAARHRTRYASPASIGTATSLGTRPFPHE